MTDRAVVVDETPDVSELPVIDKVGIVTKKTTVDADADAFSKNADELKALTGVSPVYKRKITRSINKYRQGMDGTESKQVNEQQFITGYDAFDVVQPPYNMDYLAKLYELSAPHYAAVNAKVANIVGLGYRFELNSVSKRNLEKLANDTDTKKLDSWRKKLSKHQDDMYELIESLNEEDTFTEVLTKVWRDYETMGNGYIEIGRKKDGTIGYFGHIPAQTMRIRRKRDGFVQVSGFKVQYFTNFGHKDDPNPIAGQGGKTNEVLHIKKYSPTSTYYGVPDIIAAQQAVAGNEFAARYNLDYFENKAVPRHVIVLKGARLGTTAESQLLSFFEASLKGQNHRSLYIPLPPDTADNKVELKFEKIEAGTQDSSFSNYRKSNLADILMAHRVPVTKISVSDGASLAVAKDADKTFKEQVCAPEQGIFEKKLHRIIKEMTDALDLKLNEMTLTDENTQSQIDERRRKTGIQTANEQRTRLGMSTIEGGDELFDMNKTNQAGQQRSESTTVRQRDSQRSANATDSAGNARNPKGEGRTTGG